jgi:dUTP pyrophosphatase
MIAPGEIATIGTGLSVEIPAGFFGMICSRSGLATRNGVVVLCSPGVVDSDYRGEIKCIMANVSKTPFVVKHGMRIAQFVVASYRRCCWTEATELAKSVRGSKGLGSTGLS